MASYSELGMGPKMPQIFGKSNILFELGSEAVSLVAQFLQYVGVGNKNYKLQAKKMASHKSQVDRIVAEDSG